MEQNKLEQAIAAYEAGNYAEAFKLFTLLAEEGDSDAQFCLGYMYDNGEGVEKDFQKAVYWYEKAATQGDVYAQFNLAVMYDSGERVDRQKAVYWYEQAAEQGNIHAQSNLGSKYYVGEGIERDLQKAFYWSEKAAIQGDSNAQLKLSDMYKDGVGVEKDPQRADYWLDKATSIININLLKNVLSILEHGYGIRLKIVSWLEKVATQGDAATQYKFAKLYDYENSIIINLFEESQDTKGEGVDKDLKKAVYWFEKAATQGHIDAQFRLYEIYYGGGIGQDLQKAAYWCEKAAEQGKAVAQFKLALMYKNGEGVYKDLQKAAYWYEKAATQGDEDAQYNLGIMYYKGEGVEKDFGKAAHWWEKAATQESQSAQYNLGIMYEFGLGVSIDRDAALLWYTKSVGVNLSSQTLPMPEERIAYIYLFKEKEPANALPWIQKAVAKKRTFAMLLLGYMYETGKGGLPKDKKQALSWYQQSKQLGDARAEELVEALTMSPIKRLLSALEGNLAKDLIAAQYGDFERNKWRKITMDIIDSLLKS
jgi:TPR repeat protein